ncbi:MAG TPA: VIT domain-containing protein [Flavisolibacter sp.]
MQKLSLLMICIAFSLFHAHAQQRAWDRPMQVKSCSIDIRSDQFTATTFIEIEFYNPNNQEIEGLYSFSLHPGQVITAFQLDLNGRYRDGTIEEKWKAANAYNTIVGKRIDPALLQMDGPNRYSLRIYPVPAKGTRKITMTLQQVLEATKAHYIYHLPLSIQDTIGTFSTRISVTGSRTVPFIRSGLLNGLFFAGGADSRFLNYQAHRIRANQPIEFLIPIVKDHSLCMYGSDDERQFALRVFHKFPKFSAVTPERITVFWDVSRSSHERNLEREIQFLRSYISFYRVREIEIHTFNFRLQRSEVFNADAPARWMSFLRNQQYDGATNLGAIGASRTAADAIFIFTDAVNTFGRRSPVTGQQFIYCITSSRSTDPQQVVMMTGESGGRHIDLLKTSISDAVAQAGLAENLLTDVRSKNGTTIIDQQVPVAGGAALLITGTMRSSPDTLILEYGNQRRISYTEKIPLSFTGACHTPKGPDWEALLQFEAVNRSGKWPDILLFGKDHRVVTLHTSYIVLERIEDYIRYQIEPPAELKEECESRGYVYRDPHEKLRQQRRLTESQMLQGIARSYNDRISSWGSAEPVKLPSGPRADETKITFDKATAEPTAGVIVATDSRGRSEGALNEVVVTGMYRTTRSSSASITVTRDQMLPPQNSLSQALAGRVPGLMVTPSTTTNPMATIRIRGQASVSSQPLYVLDGVPATANIDELVAPGDIQDITVLREASATALYGSKGSNGVILITTKRGSMYHGKYRSYRLKDQEDVDYLLQLKDAGVVEKMQTYRELQKQYGKDAGFYLDAADHFFAAGLVPEARTIITNASEVANGNLAVLRAMVFVLVRWEQWETAAQLCAQIMQDNPADLLAYREMAMIRSRQGRLQEAADFALQGILRNFGDQEHQFATQKALLLADLNALIAGKENQVDLKPLPPSFVRPLASDLRIVVECNQPMGYHNLTLIEPGGEICSVNSGKTRNGGYFTNEYYSNVREYQVRAARKGKYRLKIHYYDGHYPQKIPMMVRITTYRNFGRPEQSVHTENVILDNQNGHLEIAEVKWPGE